MRGRGGAACAGHALGDHRDDCAAITFELAAAHPRDLGQRRQRGRAPSRDFRQGRIVKDHVRRKLLPPRLFKAPSAQRLPQRACHRIEVGGAGPRFAIGPNRPPFAPAFLDPKADGPGATQDLGGCGRERQTPVAGNVRQNHALSDQLAVNREPSAAVQFGADAEGLQSIVPEPQDAFGLRRRAGHPRGDACRNAVRCGKLPKAPFARQSFRPSSGTGVRQLSQLPQGG